MLDKDSLAQLKQLKKEIRDNNPHFNAVVKGTQRRFGFAVLEDERQILLPPQQMERVFPGDKIKVSLAKDDKGKETAVVEILKSSELKQFNGRICFKNNNSFVVPDRPDMNRWLFIPPNLRAGCKEGDFVACEIARHPFKSRKPQARVLEVFGNIEQAGVESAYIKSKFHLNSDWPAKLLESLESHCQTVLEQELKNPHRQDFTATPFVTIDSPSTQDIDDAIHVERLTAPADGWRLRVAIADPSSFIDAGSELDKLAAQRGISTYLPGDGVSMLPEVLASNYASLQAGELRLCLVCQIDIDSEGQLSNTNISQAYINSRAKLSYQEVAGFLGNEELANNTSDSISIQADVVESLEEAQKLKNALFDYRKKHCLVMADNVDYKLVFDSNKKPTDIIKVERNVAHRLIEEFMLAANRATALWLKENNITAPFVSHPGFRPEKRETLQQALAILHPEITLGDIEQLSEYVALIQHIENNPTDSPTYEILSRMLERSVLTSHPLPHMGLGFDCYTTFTSPIRKYQDLLVHRAIKAALNRQAPIAIEQSVLEALQEKLNTSRQAARQLDQWFRCQLASHSIGKTFNAEIKHIHSRGFNVYLQEFDAVGMLEAKAMAKSHSFDPVLLEIKANDQVYKIGQKIPVELVGIDNQNHSLKFAPVQPVATATASTETATN